MAADAPAGEVAAAVVARLRTPSDWLVVLDNAAGTGDVAGVLPGGADHVLITCRHCGWSGVAAQLDVREFGRGESVAFLRDRTGRDEPEAADALAAELGDLPLALAQAAAYIDGHDLPIHRYLALYRDPAVGRRLRGAGLDTGEYPASVGRTSATTFGARLLISPAARYPDPRAAQGMTGRVQNG